jgi:hypothetical protein
MTEAEENAERYQWLRNGRSRNGGYCGTAPYVVDPNRSRLYAMEKLRGDWLDLHVDADILDNECMRLHYDNEVVERGLMPEGGSHHEFDGPYGQALTKLAQQTLGWSDKRMQFVLELENERNATK